MSYSNGFDVKIAHSVEEIEQEAWDCLGGEAFASYRWYRFGEMVRAADLPIYIVLSRSGVPVARGTFWLTRQEPLPISSPVVRYLAGALIRRWPLLTCQAPVADVSGLILPEPPLRAAALETIARVALEQMRSRHASFVVFNYLGRQVTCEPGWPGAFSSFAIPNPGTGMDIVWPDFDSYLSQLSYKTRKNYRRHCRAADELGLSVGYYPRVKAIDKAFVLMRNVERRHHQPPNPWARRALENAALADAVWLAADIDGRLVGCELLLGDRGTWMVTALGLDYSVHYVYFQLGYADIRYAIEHGVRRLRWGSCAYEAKRRLGFQLVDNNYVTFAANNGKLQWIGQRLASS